MLIAMGVLGAGFLALVYSAYTDSEGTVWSLSDLPVGRAFDDFPSIGLIGYHQGMAARDLHILVHARVDIQSLHDWVLQHNGDWEQRHPRSIQLENDHYAPVLNEIGLTQPLVVDRFFVVPKLSGGFHAMGEADSTSGWCWVTIGATY